MPSITQVLAVLFVAYISYSLWTIYGVYYPENCPKNDLCLLPYTTNKPKIQIVAFTSMHKTLSKPNDMSLVWKDHDIKYDNEFKKELKISLPSQTRKNGTLYCHIFATCYKSSVPSFNLRQLINNQFTMYYVTHLTKYMPPEAQTFSLLTDKKDPTKADTDKKKSQAVPVSHWRSEMEFHLMIDEFRFHRKSIPAELFDFIKVTSGGQFLPFLYVDDLTDRVKNYKQLNESDAEVALSITYSPISLGKLRLWKQVGQSMEMLRQLGFTEKDTDDVKGIFADTNFYLLMLTFFVAALHLLFDFLAFKNDISFWQGKKTMVGLSMRVIIWRCISQIIIFVYLMDQQTSLLVLIPAGIGSVIEVWKVKKALKVQVKWNGIFPSFQCGSATADEKETEKFDSESMKYLSYLLYPLCIGGACYSLIYTPHKSWYSWCIQSLVNGVYAFGFLFMLPQLFVNYKMKSVAHLPWRAFMYKAFNTFIDDLFAFIITMPTAHRLACFRDDIVFVIYLYQRWLYPVDKKRVNEFGKSYDDEKKTS